MEETHNVVLLTFSKSHGIKPGIIKIGFIDYDFFLNEDILPDCIHAYIHEKYMKYKTRDNEEFEVEFDHWGLSRNLFDMSKDLQKISYPFVTHMTIDIRIGEYE